MSVSYGTGDKGKATRLHSLVVRARGVCENCGERDYSKLQCAHVVTRAKSATRTDERAAFALCGKCHFHFTLWPVEWADFVVAKLGRDEYERLKLKANSTAKVDWEAEVIRLKALLQDVAA